MLQLKSEIFRRNFTGQFLECIYCLVLNLAPFQPQSEIFRGNFRGQFLYRNFTGQCLECIYGPVLNWAPFQPPARRGAPASIGYGKS